MRNHEPEAVYVGNYKMFYRATKDGKEGIAFIKNGKKPFFIELPELMIKICEGPRKEL